MNLPFTGDQFFAVFGAYNRALWPAVAVLWLLALGGAVDIARHRRVDRAVMLMLGAQWAWAGLAYHAAFFTRINSAAWLFAAVFVAESLLLLTAASRPIGNGWRLLVSWVLIVYSLAYPFLALLEGHTFPDAPTFGVPCPTTLLTIGILLACDPPVAVRLAAIPILWALLAGSSAFALGVKTDLMLIVAAVALSADLVSHRRRLAVA